MNDAARDLAKAWAMDLDERHKGVRDPLELRRIHREEQRAPDAKMGRLRRAMAALDFALFVTVLVHYQDEGVSKDKVRQVQRLVGEPMGRREYWNKLDRVSYYVAGLTFETDLRDVA